MPDFQVRPAKRFLGRAINRFWLRRIGASAIPLGAITVLLAGVPVRAPSGGLAALHASDQTPPKAAPPPADNSAPPAQPQAPNLPRFGAVKQNERCVAAALHWLANHQMPDGRWSLQKYKEQCKDESCTGPGKIEADAAATAMSILPFLAAGQTHRSNGPFKTNVASGIDWLIAHQAADGDLSSKAKQQMYSHGLASIVLCECYGMSDDKRVGDAAQKAIDFIEAAQNKKSGGWGERAGDEGDTLTLCWQMHALRSAQLAKLIVKPETLAAARKWLHSVAKTGEDSQENGLFSETPGGRPTLAATAAGLLCLQLLQEPHTAPAIVGAVENLMANLPGAKAADPRYWYFGTVAMHNMADKDWDTWNRAMRKRLVESQIRQDCAAGSWDPETPPRDDWKKSGGRVTVTSIFCLTMEPYYRYLPLFKLDRPGQNRPVGDRAAKEQSDGGK